ncbi:transposase [Escherichia coli]|uniref:transposase n=1 Tax=Escherichia coli TaxID=562 RepID=UPI001C70408F|nr:transposase [Escherichia coli]
MKKRNFSAEFKRESAQLVVDQNYTVADAASAMDVGLSRRLLILLFTAPVVEL